MAASRNPNRRAPAIGIDLGTTYSCVAVCENGNVTIIKNDMGQPITPSQVAFVESSDSDGNPRISTTVGFTAKHQLDLDPENVIFDVKRLIGRPFNDPVIQKDIQLWPFKVVDEENSPRILVNGNYYPPEKISAILLKYLKNQAEEHLGQPVTDAVITVPANFNEGQRLATKHAGSIAGLNVLRIINEPTAAAIAYNHQLQQQTNPNGGNSLQKKTVLIFDLGGGTFDLALLTMEGGNIKVKAVDGDSHLGGQDFDNALARHCIEDFKRNNDGIDLGKPQINAGNTSVTETFNAGKRLRRIKNECEIKKINLSSSRAITVLSEIIYGTLDMKVRVKREKFETLNQQRFDQCFLILDRLFRDANVTKEDVDDVVLVGGSTRIPKIKDMLEIYFGKAPCQNIRQDEAVAYGAAVVASQMISESSDYGPREDSLPHVEITDVTPHSIGVQVNAGREDVNDFLVILKKNTTLPCEGEQINFTGYDNQREAMISVYEGESPNASNNYKLGEFVITLPPNCPAGQKVKIEMQVNNEGILRVVATRHGDQSGDELVVQAFKGRLTDDQLTQLRADDINVPPIHSGQEG